MTDMDLSVLDHLKEAAIKLNLSNTIQNIDGLCEREIAYQINQHYQTSEKNEAMASVQKRKIQLETESIENKKIKVCQKVYDHLSALEKLPNEVYEIILGFSDPEAKKNLRVASRWLYGKTTLMDPMFDEICYTPTKGYPPDFILETESDIRICICDDDIPPIKSLINMIMRFAHRISSLEISKNYSDCSLMKSLPDMRPLEFKHLTSLHLENQTLDNSLMLLAPQLETLSLSNVKFDPEPSVDLYDTSFTKLKKLVLVHSCIEDVSKILIKSSRTLEHLELDQIVTWLDDVMPELPALKVLKVELSDGHVKAPRGLISKSARTLRSLTLFVQNKTDIFSTLVERNSNLKITSLEIKGEPFLESRGNFYNFESLLKACPLIQRLSLRYCCGQLGEVVLKDLIKLELFECDVQCFSSVLSQATKSPLKTLEISGIEETYAVIAESGLPRLQELDTIWFHDFKVEFEQLIVYFKLFHAKAQVNLELVEEGKAVMRRVYALQ